MRLQSRFDRELSGNQQIATLIGRRRSAIRRGEQIRGRKPSGKPQSISPPESLHLYGGQNLIHFGAGSVGEGGGGAGGGGGYDNNNSALDTYITSAALNQQYDALPGHQQQQLQQQHLHPDQWNSSMAAVYGVSPSSYNRQMR
ncbi:hypothetical protein AND_001505 [Anopheles darlingi]|uniref:Uncharacterized protein n=1 Tax=Anopheles darlingi TaxID=43151 RepID=W5JUS9_ANODA|nr:hypothetical protein AND_001505 [Anopheles darlingi]